MTSETMLEEGLKQLTLLKEDSAKMGAADLHELMRCWENYHRILSLEAHARHIRYREETRYPGYYYRGDFNFIDDDKWKVFTCSTYDMESGEFTMSTREHRTYSLTSSIQTDNIRVPVTAPGVIKAIKRKRSWVSASCRDSSGKDYTVDPMNHSNPLSITSQLTVLVTHVANGGIVCPSKKRLFW